MNASEYKHEFEFWLEDELFAERHAVVHYNFESGSSPSFSRNPDSPGYSDPGCDDCIDWVILINGVDVSGAVNEDIVTAAIYEDLMAG